MLGHAKVFFNAGNLAAYCVLHPLGMWLKTHSRVLLFSKLLYNYGALILPVMTTVDEIIQVALKKATANDYKCKYRA